MKKKKKYQSQSNESKELKTIIKIIVGVVLFLGVIGLLSAIFLTGEFKLKEDKKTVEIQYSEILAEQTFKQKEDEYYVLYYEFDSNDAPLIGMLMSKISSNATVYKVDLSKGFNKNYITDSNASSNASKLSELKVTSPSLARVKNKKIIKMIHGLDNIKNYSSNM